MHGACIICAPPASAALHKLLFLLLTVMVGALEHFSRIACLQTHLSSGRNSM